MSDHEQHIHIHIHLDGTEGVVAAFTDRHMLRQIVATLQELKIMSGTLDQQLADLTTLAQKQSDDFAKFKADVDAALAAIQSGGALTPAQQAAIDNLRTIMTATDTAVTAADSALPGAAPAPTV